jgi:hypothetical protein
MLDFVPDVCRELDILQSSQADTTMLPDTLDMMAAKLLHIQ